MSEMKSVTKLMDDVIRLQQQLKEATQRNEEWQQSFDLYHDAEMRAIKMWRDGGGDELVWPDAAKLTTWLLQQLAEANERIEFHLAKFRIPCCNNIVHDDSSRKGCLYCERDSLQRNLDLLNASLDKQKLEDQGVELAQLRKDFEHKNELHGQAIIERDTLRARVQELEKFINRIGMEYSYTDCKACDKIMDIVREAIAKRALEGKE